MSQQTAPIRVFQELTPEEMRAMFATNQSRLDEETIAKAACHDKMLAARSEADKGFAYGFGFAAGVCAAGLIIAVVAAVMIPAGVAAAA